VLPGYRHNGLFFLYVFVYVCVGAYLVLNLAFLAVLSGFHSADQLAKDRALADKQVHTYIHTTYIHYLFD
jgi:hypothetical protein